MLDVASTAALEDFDAQLTTGGPGVSVEDIGGVEASHDATSMVALVDDVVIILASTDPQKLDDVAAFIQPFLAAQPRS